MIKKKILILGKNGFLAKNLAAKLRKTDFVITFGTRKEINQKITVKNLLNLNLNFDYIINCAGEGTVNQSYRTKFNNDLDITKNVISYIINHQSNTKLIHISTASVFGNSIKKSKLKPISPYAYRKLSCEKLIIKKLRNRSLDYKILRFFSIYGNGLRKQILWDACNKIKRKNPIFFGSGDEVRSWMHIDDFCKILIKVMNLNKTKKKIFNFCGTQTLKNKELLLLIFKAYGTKYKPKFNLVKNKGTPDYMFIKNCDLNIIKFKQKINLTYGIKKYIKWIKKI